MNKIQKIFFIFLLIILIFSILNRLSSFSSQNNFDNTISDYDAIQPETAKTYISKAHKAFDEKDYYVAIALWEKSLELKSHHPELVYNDIGLSYFNLRDYKNAEYNLLKSIEIRPTCVTHTLLGKTYFETKSYYKAKENFEKALLNDVGCDNIDKRNIYTKLSEIEANNKNFKKSKEYLNLAKEQENKR